MKFTRHARVVIADLHVARRRSRSRRILQSGVVSERYQAAYPDRDCDLTNVPSTSL